VGWVALSLTLHIGGAIGLHRSNTPRTAPPWSTLRGRRQQDYDTERTDPIVIKELVSTAMEFPRRAVPLAAVFFLNPRPADSLR
jgi:hypothetical protein